LIQKYFDEIALDTGKYCFGVTDTLKALDMGAVETLIVWESLEITRNTLRNAAGGTRFPLSARISAHGCPRGDHRSFDSSGQGSRQVYG